MGILQKIKSLLGLGSNGSEPGETETTVTIERESDDRSDVVSDDEVSDDGVSDAEEPTKDAEIGAEENEDELDDEIPDDEQAGDTESSDVGSIDSDEETAASEESDPDAKGSDAEVPDAEGSDAEEEPMSADAEPETGDPDGDSVELIKGIGPAYGERLAAVGIETVDQLAAADPAEVADGASVSDNRASTWIERAKEF